MQPEALITECPAIKKNPEVTLNELIDTVRRHAAKELNCRKRKIFWKQKAHESFFTFIWEHRCFVLSKRGAKAVKVNVCMWISVSKVLLASRAVQHIT